MVTLPVKALDLLNDEQEKAIADEAAEDDHQIEDDVTPSGVVVWVNRVVVQRRTPAAPEERQKRFALMIKGHFGELLLPVIIPAVPLGHHI